jgi:hypothetical protein
VLDGLHPLASSRQRRPGEIATFRILRIIKFMLLAFG